MLWAILAFVIVAATKYRTSLRLRTLRERMQQDQRATDDLRRKLGQVAQNEDVLRAQTGALVAKVTALHNVVQNLERKLSKASSVRASELPEQS
jgi:hypothetical protein